MTTNHRLLITAFCFALSLTAKADPILDTGTPTGEPAWEFSSGQYFGAEFSITSPTTIDSIEGYLGNEFSATAGNVEIELLNVGADGYTVGSLDDSTSVTLGAHAALGWYGVSGLDWNIGAGNYWVAFVPGANISGEMPGTAPSPAEQYAQGGSSGWENTFVGESDEIKAGVMVDGVVSAPDGGPTAILLGAAFLGLAALRRRFART